jgi:hypothetical protein
LDIPALRGAISEVFRRHEALRTVLAWNGETSGHQVVLEDWSVDLPIVDLCGLEDSRRESELERMLREHGRRPFDLGRELLLRTTLFRLAPDEYVLLFQTHHVAFDAWAVEIFYRDLGELYDAARSNRSAKLPELSMRYADFARRQRARLRGDLLDRELDFWRTELAGAPTVMRLPTDKQRPSEQTFDGASQRIIFGPEIAQSLRRLSIEHQVTPYMLLLAAFATLLYRSTGQDDLLFSGPMANREDPDLEHLIGFFANTIVVRARLTGNPEFKDLLTTVRESVLQSYEHQEVPLELVVDAVRPQRQRGVNPLVQVNFRVRVGEPPVLRLSGAETSLYPVDLGLARFDFSLELHLFDDRLEAEFNYNIALFEASTIARFAADFERLLAQAVVEPSRRLLAFELTATEDYAAASDLPAAGGVREIRRFREGSSSAQ